MEKRKEKRLQTKLYVNLKSGTMTGSGLLCDVSENGLFLQCTRDFTIGAVVDIEIFLPGNNDSLVKGVVRRKIDLTETHRKHGLGIELIEKDPRYTIFVRSVSKTPAGETVNAAG